MKTIHSGWRYDKKAGPINEQLLPLWWLYLLLFIVGLSLTAISFCSTLLPAWSSFFLSVGASLLASVIVGFLFDLANSVRLKKKMRWQRRVLLVPIVNFFEHSSSFFVNSYLREKSKRVEITYYCAWHEELDECVNYFISNSCSSSLTNLVYYFAKGLAQEESKRCEDIVNHSEWDETSSFSTEDIKNIKDLKNQFDMLSNVESDEDFFSIYSSALLSFDRITEGHLFRENCSIIVETKGHECVTHMEFDVDSADFQKWNDFLKMKNKRDCL